MSEHKCTDCMMKSSAAKYLTKEEADILVKHSVEVKFKKGEIIIKQDALTLNVAYLKSGIAKLHLHGPTHEKILKVVKAPCYIGIPTTFGDKINQFSATGLDETTVCFIDSSLFKNFIYNNGRFAYEILVELCQGELFDYHRYASLAQKQIPGLVAETLLCFADKIYENNKFNLPLSRIEMGDLVGTSRESISRVLSDLSNEKVIEMNGSEINIIKKDRLKQISDKG